MTPKIKSTDPDIRASLPAMKRAAHRARTLARTTGTPMYAFKNGRVVNLNPGNSRPLRKKA